MADLTCAAQGCDRPAKAQGYCAMHYRRFKKYGDPLMRVRRPPGGYCEVPGCTELARRWGLCGPHSRRLRTHGDPTVSVYQPRGSAFPSDLGYLRVTRPDHPLASKRGVVYVHRMVLYDKIGPGTHPCHWCGKPVTWRPGVRYGDALVADHLDFDPSNNDPANLVPSCHLCNCVRHRPKPPCNCTCHMTAKDRRGKLTASVPQQ